MLPIVIILVGGAVATSIIWFNRSPNIAVESTEGVVKPCDGKLDSVEVIGDKLILQWFLGLQNIHEQYSPVSGTVIDVTDVKGPVRNAKHMHTNVYAKPTKQIITTINTIYGGVCISQVAGVLTPTIKNYLAPGDKVVAGQSIGHIYLGSRVILEVPRQCYSEDLLKEKIGGRQLKVGSSLFL
jgi:phosphatidylserine decarboxylase precursor-related protein